MTGPRWSPVAAAAVLLLALAARADIVVTADGTLVEGDEVRVQDGEIVVVRGGKEQSLPCTSVCIAEKTGGELVWAPNFPGRMRGYAHLARAERRDRCVSLLDEALDAFDSTLARKLLDRAEANGFTGKKAETLKRRLERLEKKNPRVKEDKVAEIVAQIDALDALFADLLVKRARVAGGEDGLRLLREALLVSPEHAEAGKLLAERAAKDFPAGDARFWLDWHLDLESVGARLIDMEKHADLMALRALWRPDVYAFEAGPIRLVTPLRETRTVGRCLAYGQLTCRLLGEMFKPENPQPRAAQHLTVVLYGSKEEYLARSTGSSEERKHLEWSLGHYSPSDQLSRVFWSPDRDAERRIARTFVHELTHQWIAEMNPYYRDAELRGRGMPAYWIVEGIAEFVEESSLNVDRGTWSLFDSRSPALDAVQALSGSGKLIPWESLYSMGQHEFRRLRREADAVYYGAWVVGKQVSTQGNLFYDQAAATCHYLFHAEGGRYRQHLIDLVVARYTGQKEKLDIAAALGTTPQDLGLRVEAFAKQVAAGWRPK